MSPSSRIPLIGAVVATPLFVILWAIQAATRDGFRPLFHPMSLLSLGDGGWVQIGNFVATGILFIAGGVALTRTLPGGRLPVSVASDEVAGGPRDEDRRRATAAGSRSRLPPQAGGAPRAAPYRRSQSSRLANADARLSDR